MADVMPRDLPINRRQRERHEARQKYLKPTKGFVMPTPEQLIQTIRQAGRTAVEANAAYLAEERRIENDDLLTPSERKSQLQTITEGLHQAIATERRRMEEAANVYAQFISGPPAADPDTRAMVRQALGNGVTPASIIERARTLKRPELLMALDAEIPMLALNDGTGAFSEGIARQVGQDAADVDPTREIRSEIVRARADLGDSSAQHALSLLQSVTVAEHDFRRASMEDGSTLREALEAYFETGVVPYAAATDEPETDA